MVGLKEARTPRVTAEVELANYKDLVLSQYGHISFRRVRRLRALCDVDQRRMHLIIPASVAKQLGLRASGIATVRYADGRTAKRYVVKDLYLKFVGRQGVFTAIVERKRKSISIGGVVMQDLDLVVDYSEQRLVPRDRGRIIAEI